MPGSLGAAGLQIITTIDAAVYMYQLKGAAGMAAEADRLKGIYNFCQTIFNLPCAFITPLTISVIPAITEQLTLRRRKSANMVAESAVRVMSLIAMPCSVGLAVLSEPIMRLLGGYTEARLTLASTLMSILGFCVFFNSFVLVMNAIMQAHGYVYTPVVTMILGGIVKIIINAILVGNPKINIVGAPIGTLICYVMISCLNLWALHRLLRRPPRLLINLYKPAIAAALMGGVAFLVNRLCLALELPLLVRTAGSILVAGAVYVGLVLVLRIITADDCRLLPKGDKIARLLRIQ